MHLVMASERLAAALGRPLAVFGTLITKLLASGHAPRSLRKHAFTGSEVFIATYSKSGTNWAIQLALQTAHRGAAEFGHVFEEVPWPEGLPTNRSISLAQACASPRSPTGKVIVKTHLPASAVPYDPRAAYITVIRDPKEVAVSAYHFMVGMVGYLDIVDFDEWYRRFVYDAALLEGWAGHTASYWAMRERANVLVLTYSDMKADLDGCARRFAEVMGVELSEAEHAEVVRRAGFEHMKANDAQFAPPLLPLRRDRPLPAMVRRGVAGRSDELLSPERQRELDAWCEARLRELGSDFPYAERFASEPR